MAEFVMKDLLQKEGYIKGVQVESAATSTEEIGNSVHPETRGILASKGILCSGKRARQMTREDCVRFDFLIGMDDANIRNIKRIGGKYAEGKTYKLMEFCGSAHPIADPWYTGDFDATYVDVRDGCVALLAYLKSNRLLIQ